MAVNPANMEDCTPKSRCLNGPNEGVAYDRDSPCGGAANVAFNPVTCDCEATEDCVGSDECGYDIDWAIEAGANTLWSIKLCGASSCSTDCAIDSYRSCATYNASSGSTYLSPGKCLRQVKLLTDGPCPIDSPAPGGAYTRMDWYACNPGEVDPGIPTCSTAIAQMPGGGYCSTVITGPGIVEQSRIQRVKLATSTRFEYSLATGGLATCSQCDPPDSYFPTSSGIGWKAPVEDGSYQVTTFSSISPACGGSGSCPSTWRGYTGTDWVQVGNALYNADATLPPCAVSDGLALVATAGLSQNGITKGETIAYVVAYGSSGAVGCSQEGSHIPGAVTTTGYNCYKPSDLV